MDINNLCKPSSRFSPAAFCLLLAFCLAAAFAVHPAPVAASDADSLAKTIDKDKQSDGSWTKLYGRIMHSAKMLEVNIHR